MNYHFHYSKLVERAKNRILNGYGEWHHIKPRCLGGSDNRVNLVHLTAEEHFVAHQILVKMYPGHPGLVYGLKRLGESKTAGRNKKRVRSNKMYGWIKRKATRTHSEFMMGNQYSPETQFKPGQKACGTPFQKGQDAHNKGKFWINNGTRNKSHNQSNTIPNGWSKGTIKSISEETRRKLSDAGRKGGSR